MKQLILSLLVFTSITAGYSQQEKRCGNSEYTSKLLSEHPQTIVKPHFSGHSKSNDLKIIPVVFHILHEYGYENISDQQVINSVSLLNTHFNMENPNLALIDPSFHDIIADCNIEFRLATIDPDGNCTNGIEHIFTHETNQADDWSKFNQWPREKYLNIWVVKSISNEGIGGYTYMPEVADSDDFAHLDGILMLHNYIGEIGTGSTITSRSLTHEVGHYLGLHHTWGDGPAQEACGDDGISDTPETMGGYACSQNQVLCNAGVVENIENFMHTVYCSGMFTDGQADYMHSVLESDIADRSNLWQEANLIATGTLNPSGVCSPIADFSVNTPMNGINLPVQFKDFSWNGSIISYQWLFPGANPSSSTEQNPTVTYSAEGFYDAQLIVSNSAGSDTLFIEDIVHISADWGDFFGPYTSGFEEETANWWIVQNPEDANGGFELTPFTGVDGSTCFALNNFYDVEPESAISEEEYYNTLGNTNDAIISPAYHLANTSNVTISFDYAGAFLTADTNEINAASLKLFSSRDYGRTWTLRATLTGKQINTAPLPVTENYIPQEGDWKSLSKQYNTSATLDHRTRFKLQYIAADSSNNFYIDNFKIDGILSLDDQEFSHIRISPNPLKGQGEITIAGLENGMKSEITIRDIKGSVVSNTVTFSDQTTLDLALASGCYFLTVACPKGSFTNKIIVVD